VIPGCSVGGIAGLHELIGQCPAEDDEPDQVVVGIETDRGRWVQALVHVADREFPAIVSGYRDLLEWMRSHGTLIAVGWKEPVSTAPSSRGC
jgi:hypothetical protein